MTTLPDRPHTALLVVDVQNGVVAGARCRLLRLAASAGQGDAHCVEGDRPVLVEAHCLERAQHLVG